jgi:MarR family 2-MHQ and catechol resistance regulon transcriptional repressor
MNTETDLDLRLWTVLARAYAAVEKHSFADIERHGLTPGEFGILETLYHRGPLLLGDLQRRVLVSSGGVSYLVDRLERKGLVERRDYPEDRRTRLAALTPEGEKLIAWIFPEHARAIQRALDAIDPEVKQAAVALLRTIGRAAAAVDS